MSVLVGEKGQILRTKGGANLESSGPFQKSSSGKNTIATSSVPFGGYSSNALELIGGATISYTALYRSQPYVASAVDELARQISRLPLKVYEFDSQNERKRVTEHRLVDLIKSPAPRCAASQLKQWMALPILLHGNSTLLKARTEKAGPPSRLWPLDWRFMAPHFDQTIVGIDFWKTSEFRGMPPLDPEDVVHTHWEAPDGRIGVSPLEQLGITLRIEQAAQRYQETYLGKGARPSGSISLPQGVVLDKDLRAEMREDLEDVYGGPEQGGRPALLPGGAEWKDTGHNAHEAELINQRKLTREEVASVYKVPQPLMGILDHATYSNVAELHRMLYTTVLGPWLTLIEETFQAQIIAPEPAFQGLFVEFDLAEVLKGDKVKEINALKIAVSIGLLTLNEARGILNMPAFKGEGLEWCSKPLIPANNLRSAPESEGNSNGNGSSDSGEADREALAAIAEHARANGH